MSEHLQVGQYGENAAAAYLESRGYRIVARNYRCPIGELDIVAARDGVLTFVEVKTRAHPAALPEESVRLAKRRTLTRLALSFVKRYKLHHLPCQFDVLAINRPGSGTQHIEHFENAFEACD